MFKKSSFVLCLAAALAGSLPTRASDIVYAGGGTLAQIFDGAGSTTTITLVNLDISSTAPAAYTLSFYDDNGQPLTLITNQGTFSTTTGGLPPGGSIIIQTNGTYAQNHCSGAPGLPIVCGYAVLATGQLTENSSTGVVTSLGNQIAGSAVFSLALGPGNVPQASGPLDTGGATTIALPFDETGDAASAQTGVALVNSLSVTDVQFQPLSIGETAYIQVAFYDQNGASIPVSEVPTVILPFGWHTSFMLDSSFPEIKGKKGMVVLKGTDSSGYAYIIKALGLRATATTLTSITPIIPCNPYIYPAGSGAYTGTYGGCNNY